jgi:hypothetical protein
MDTDETRIKIKGRVSLLYRLVRNLSAVVRSFLLS